MDQLFPFPRTGSSFLTILKDPFSRKIFGHEAEWQESLPQFTTGLTTRLDFLIHNPANHLSLFKLGYTCLEAFLQSNVTGPPLEFDTKEVIFPRAYHGSVVDLRKQISASLTVQGESIYSLTPQVELFWVAKQILSNDRLCEGFNGRRARMRVNFWHQKLLPDPSDFLRDQIYTDAEVLEGQLTSRLIFQGAAADYHFVEFLVEKAVIDVYYGNDAKARTYLAKAAKLRGFEFVLTGALGKRTKFQDRDLSQLVVLALSSEEEIEDPYSRTESTSASSQNRQPGTTTDASPANGGDTVHHTTDLPPSTTSNNTKTQAESPNPSTLHKPENLPLDDDTLLESIHFAPPQLLPEVLPNDSSILPASLAALNPSSQPLLKPFDAIILLQIASSISNTSPADGLTREETLPYATRVLEGGASNWQVYTQALLVRSRIEGYRSRTAERGLLQLHALVDQVIVETTTTTTTKTSSDGSSPMSGPQSPPSSFLPAARPAESAPVAERLKHIYQLHPPLRWELEAELAARWVSMGGLKTALDIYERLQMHAEVALCLAATNEEKKAIRRIRELLFKPVSEEETQGSESTGVELGTLPPNAPRLYCILGDLEDHPQHYERAWTISEGHYHRAQRSLGRYYVRKKNFPAAAEAYIQSLRVNRLNAATWFALGCVQLELEAFSDAVESFTRTVQLEADDAEAWSNLAAALLRLPNEEETDSPLPNPVETMPEDDLTSAVVSPLLSPPPTRKIRKQQDALLALRRAAKLKHDDSRIWDNYLTVAASIPPPLTPWSEIILAQKRLIALRGKKLGERAVDEKILTVLVRYVTSEFVYPGGSEVGSGVPFPRGHVAPLLVALVDEHVMPLITSSAILWLLVADLNVWRHRPLAALEALEKAWRCVIGRKGVYDFENENEKEKISRVGKEGGRGNGERFVGWDGVVDATIRLVRGYEELGMKVRERELGKEEEEAEEGVGEKDADLVAKDWRFKAQSAVRAVMGRGKEMWMETEGWERLVIVLEGLKVDG